MLKEGEGGSKLLNQERVLKTEQHTGCGKATLPNLWFKRLPPHPRPPNPVPHTLTKLGGCPVCSQQ